MKKNNPAGKLAEESREEYAMEQMTALNRELSELTGVAEEEVAKILDALGQHPVRKTTTQITLRDVQIAFRTALTVTMK